MAAEDVEDPHETDDSGRRTLLVEAGKLIDEDTARAIEEVGHRDRQDPLGADLRGQARTVPHVLWPQSGHDVDGRPRRSGWHHCRAVDRRAGTQLTLRTFHIGGTAARIAEQTSRKSKVAGRIEYGDRLVVVTGPDGQRIVTSYEGEISIRASSDRHRDRSARGCRCRSVPS